MKYRIIPNTDLNASIICLGTSNLGTPIGERESSGIVDAYADCGGNFLDTAEVYANWLPVEPNSSERFIGKWMKERGSRSRMVLATKGGHPRLETPAVSRLSDSEIRDDIEGSLQRLQTDYIDLYYLHRDDPNRPVELIVELLEEQVRKGNIRHYACSNWSLDRMEQARQYAAKQGYTGFAAASNLWNLGDVSPGAIQDPSMVATDRELIVWHAETGMPLIPYSSQANGFFSGKYRRDQTVTPELAKTSVFRKYANETNFARLERVERIARKRHATPNQIALACLLAQPFPVYPVVGCKHKEHVLDSVGAADIELDPQTVSYIWSGGQ
ncbi:aldo/keto reductase [Paenibacillus piri]|uniref:aldo/keto reductase n=1 Tax=Paenibacillus piri TaxID=2547395 RepID=UPI001404DD26|nr:aldo/keto reductase [Paenibacillus piri]